MDAELRPQGWEIRLHPSTKRTATIGGFVAGGSGGVGSVTYGGLREPGNIVAARVVTVEEEPRVIELRGDAAQKVNRAYGTTGIITALEMPLAPAYSWIDVVVAFDDFFDAAQVGLETALADGIIKKLVTPRLVACAIVLPSLTALADVFGLIAGSVVVNQTYDIPYDQYFRSAIDTVSLMDFGGGIFKSFVFGLIIAIVGCFKGFSVTGGTEGVGQATTETVAIASVSVCLSDFFMTKLFLAF
jgi:hypothetical protein